jgi:hypothetical protein
MLLAALENSNRHEALSRRNVLGGGAADEASFRFEF